MIFPLTHPRNVQSMGYRTWLHPRGKLLLKRTSYMFLINMPHDKAIC